MKWSDHSPNVLCYFQDLLLSCYFNPHKTQKEVWYIDFLQAKLFYPCRKFDFKVVITFVIFLWPFLDLANAGFSWQNLMLVSIVEIWWKHINPLNSSCLTMKKAWKSGGKFCLWLVHRANRLKMISCVICFQRWLEVAFLYDRKWDCRKRHAREGGKVISLGWLKFVGLFFFIVSSQASKMEMFY